MVTFKVEKKNGKFRKWISTFLGLSEIELWQYSQKILLKFLNDTTHHFNVEIKTAVYR